MRDFFFFVFTLFLLFLPHKNNRCSDYSLSSIHELIEFETAEILNSDVSNYQELSEKYLSRAESYLIAGDHELAFFDFQASYELAMLSNQEDNRLLLFQSLFGQAIVYGCNEMLGEFHQTVQALRDVLNMYSCEFCERNSSQSLSLHTQSEKASFCNDNPMLSFSRSLCNTKLSTQLILASTDRSIYGPDRISVAECIQFAEGTTRKCRYLISLVPKSEVRVLLNIVIDDLENKAFNVVEQEEFGRLVSNLL